MALVFAFLALAGLLAGVLQDNEVAFLPWARQAVEPSWISNDWLLSSPLRSQWLAGTIVGHLVSAFGFFWGSIVARVVCYAMLAYGLAALIRHLRVPATYLCVVLFVFVALGQALASGEWLIGAAEPKVFAMASALIGLPWLLQGRFFMAGAAVGLAASFHILVGGYACLTAIAYALVYRAPVRSIAIAAGGFILLGSVGIFHAAQELLQPAVGAEASRIMTHIRLPQHTLPQFFGWKYPIKIALLVGFVVLAWRYSDKESRQVFVYALLSMIPFAVGMAVWPFDQDGLLLKYYPFRYGDVFLPLLVPIAGYKFVERLISDPWLNRATVTACLIVFALTAVSSYDDLQRMQRISPKRQAWLDATIWIRDNTPNGVLVVAPPGKEDFTLLSERASIVQFKLSPFTLSMYPEWARRLEDVSGDPLPEYGGFGLVNTLNESYFDRSADELAMLMRKYGASYALTLCHVVPNEPDVIYRNDTYCVLGTIGSGETP